MKRQLIPVRNLQEVSICTALFNRSEQYLDVFLKSLSKVRNPEKISLSIFDCGSMDVNDLENEIRKRWKGKIIFTSRPVPFNRSHALNHAVEASSSPILLICDADMWLPENIVTLCNNYTGSRVAWFPIYFFLYKSQNKNEKPKPGIWEQFGSKGMLACLKSDFRKLGGYDEGFISWGGEDTELWERFHSNRFIVIRNRQKGLFHHWHETFNPKFMWMNGL